MKKILSIILLVIVSFLINGREIKAKEVSEVNLYLFYSTTCPHCEKERKFLNELIKEYDNLNVYEYEISNKDANDLLKRIEDYYDIKVTGIPYTIIGDKRMSGYSESETPRIFREIIDYYSENGYIDEVIDIFDVKTIPHIINSDSDIDEHLNEVNNKKIPIPLIGSINSKDIALPFITIIIGLLDGINPCAMWVLLFLISMLIGMKNKKRMWTLGISFILVSGIIYYLFMVSWLNITSYLSSVKYLRMFIAVIAMSGGIINLVSYYKHRKESGCDIIDDKKRSKIFSKVKKFTTEKSIVLAILGIITLAISVNLVELACSAGLPVLYIEILKINNLSNIEYYMYLFMYVIFFLLDDFIIFFIAILTMEMTGFSTKFGKLTKLIGGILLLLIGIIMFVRPEWLMFNFK